jgi:hypothetical protein
MSPFTNRRHTYDHDRQKEIGNAFLQKSRAGFSFCCGCINGMLLWMEKPTKPDCSDAGIGSGKLFCERKQKFGLCLEGICDADWKFLDVVIKHPASTSDYLAFSTSSIRYKVEKRAF